MLVCTSVTGSCQSTGENLLQLPCKHLLRSRFELGRPLVTASMFSPMWFKTDEHNNTDLSLYHEWIEIKHIDLLTAAHKLDFTDQRQAFFFINLIFCASIAFIHFSSWARKV